MTRPQDTSRNASDRVDQAGMESFPASDAPSWTLGLDPHRNLDAGELRLLRAMLVAKRDELLEKRGRHVQDAALLGEVEHALAKFESGRYGLSELSGRPIRLERLCAVPWARDDTAEAERREHERD